MVKLLVNVALAAWLFASAFVIPHTSASAWNAMIVAVLVATVAFLAFAVPGRPGMKWIISALATWLLVSTMLLPQASLGTLMHDVVVAALLAFVSLLPSRRWAPGNGRTAHAA